MLKKWRPKTIWTLRKTKTMLMMRRLTTKSKRRKLGRLKQLQMCINQMLRKSERKGRFNVNYARKRLKNF